MNAAKTDPSPPASAAPDERTPPGRWAARLSIMAAFVCFTLMCSFQQLTAKTPLDAVRWLYLVLNCVAMAVVLGGVVLGGYGLAIGLRRRSLDTAGIAVIGLVLNLGIVFVVVWGWWLIRQVGPQ